MVGVGYWRRDISCSTQGSVAEGEEPKAVPCTNPEGRLTVEAAKCVVIGSNYLPVFPVPDLGIQLFSKLWILNILALTRLTDPRDSIPFYLMQTQVLLPKEGPTWQVSSEMGSESWRKARGP